MAIKLKEQECVYSREENHYKLDVNGKEIWVMKWYENSNFPSITDGDTEIIKGKELLTEEEKKEAIDFVNDL